MLDLHRDRLRLLVRQHRATAREIVARERAERVAQNRFHTRSTREHTADVLLRIAGFVAENVLMVAGRQAAWQVLYREIGRTQFQEGSTHA